MTATPVTIAPKTAVITGSTQGIGRAVARALLARGLNIVVSAPGAREAHDCAVTLDPGGRRVIGVACDITVRAQGEALWAAGQATFGRVDLWINNAGLALTGPSLADLPEADLRQMLDINVIGTLLGSQVALAGMREAGGAVYTMLGAGADGLPVPRMGGYATSKAALTFLTRSLAAETAGSRVLIGALSPGLVITEGFLREHARVAPQDRAAREAVVNVIGDHPATIGRWAARIVDTNTQHGRVFTWLNRARIRARAAQVPPRDILSRYRDRL